MIFKKAVYKLMESIYFSWSIRYAWIRLLRIFFFCEYADLQRYVSDVQKGAPKKVIVALNCRSVAFEHIKEIYSGLKEHPAFLPVPITTTKFPPARQKKKIFPYFESRYGLVYGKNYFSYLWLEKLNPAAYLELYPTVYGDPCRSAVKIIYAHGLANLGFSKDFRHIRLIGKYDYLFLTGPMHKRALLYAQKIYGGRLPKMVEIGFLRGDRLLVRAKNFDRETALRRMGLEDRFTVLFAPTWGEFSATREWIDRIVDMARDLDCNVLLRLHPILTGGRLKWETAGVEWELKLKQLAERYKRVHIAADDDIDDYLLTADACVTDVSSVGMEFMLLEKPVFFVPAPNFFKTYGRERPIAWVREGLEVWNSEDLKASLANCMAGNPRARPSLLEKILYNPGKALVAAISFFEDLLLK